MQWLRVCDENFDQNLARLACRALGLTGGERGSKDYLPINGEYPHQNADPISNIDCGEDNVDSFDSCLGEVKRWCEGPNEEDFVLVCTG